MLVFPIESIFSYSKLEHEGYIEAKSIFEEKIKRLKSNLSTLDISINYDLCELGSLADEIKLSTVEIVDGISVIKEKK